MPRTIGPTSARRNPIVGPAANQTIGPTSVLAVPISKLGTLKLEGVKMYSSLVEAMMDLKYKDLRGEDLVNAYTADILETEQRLQAMIDLERKGSRG